MLPPSPPPSLPPLSLGKTDCVFVHECIFTVVELDEQLVSGMFQVCQTDKQTNKQQQQQQQQHRLHHEAQSAYGDHNLTQHNLFYDSTNQTVKLRDA